VELTIFTLELFLEASMSHFSKSRRKAVSLALGSVVLAPWLLTAGRSRAAQNTEMRAALKYQDTPMKDQRCSKCAQFIPGKTPKDRGGCKVIPGDTEISPNGWCTAFTPMPEK
jgi:hypothetical protein